jgi:excinuclease ABC subunit C
MKYEDVKKISLPDTPGVYFFKQGKKILYIGRATSLKDRVRSYFSADVIASRGPRIVDMVHKADTVTFEVADSVLEAIINEARSIKRFQPYYNVKEKDDKSFNYVAITKDAFPAVVLVRGKDLEASKYKAVFGPFPHGSLLRESLRIIRRLFPYRDAKCVPYDEQLAAGRIPKPCFNQQIGLCPGVCIGALSKREYAQRIREIVLFFKGEKRRLVSTLKKTMDTYAAKEEFERATKVRNRIFALEHIRDVSLMKEEPTVPRNANEEKKLARIEGYDIAHTSGKNMVGVMVVMERGDMQRSLYRLFNIKSVSHADDTASLKEVLTRRLAHPEWAYPSLIVVDGGLAQKRVAEQVLAEHGFDIAVAAVVKDEHHRPKHILGGWNESKDNVLSPGERLTDHYRKEILLVNSEAHRFAITHHRKKRGKIV